MPRFSITWLLMVTTLIAASLAAVIAVSNNFRLREQVGDTTYRLRSFEKSADKSRAARYHAGLGASLITKIALDAETNRKLLENLGAITPESLGCSVHQFGECPNVRLFHFFEIQNQTDGKSQQIGNSLSVCILVDSDSLDIADSTVHSGISGKLDYMNTNPWTIGWEQPDGSTIEYRIKATGFERVQ